MNIVKILDRPDSTKEEMHPILQEFSLPYKFPKEVEKEANNLPVQTEFIDSEPRRDFRKIPTFTIDPEDAKDFDDALSIRKLQNSSPALYEVGVHIADVSHYVKPNTLIDIEASKRGTSVYLVDRVVPMLPEKLSNNICSLLPNEDRLCFSVVFEIDENSNVLSEWFGKTIIRSQRRFNYDEVQKIIDSGKGDFAEEIAILNSLSYNLRQNRMKNGSIDFAKEEIKIKVDEHGKPLSIRLYQPTEANNLIEEFMLLANRKVAEFIKKKNRKVGVYRVHDLPEREKLEEFAHFVRFLGYKIKIDTPRHIAESLNNLLDKVKGRPEASIITTLAIRTMAKARYSTNNIGHFGLAFDTYTHFTSPIRRYPDILVHRLLEYYLSNPRSRKKPFFDREKLEELCEHSSLMEQKAMEAEFASIKYKQLEFLKERIGKTYEGIITNINEIGLFVEIIDLRCDGMIHFSDIGDDFYRYDRKNFCARGKYYGREFRIGEKIKVMIQNVNLAKKWLDLMPTD